MRGRFRNRLLFDINTPSKLQWSKRTTEEEDMTFATELDQRRIHNSERQQSFPCFQGVREPLCGHWPWPYDCRGCQVSESLRPASVGLHTSEVRYSVQKTPEVSKLCYTCKYLLF